MLPLLTLTLLTLALLTLALLTLTLLTLTLLTLLTLTLLTLTLLTLTLLTLSLLTLSLLTLSLLTLSLLTLLPLSLLTLALLTLTCNAAPGTSLAAAVARRTSFLAARLAVGRLALRRLGVGPLSSGVLLATFLPPLALPLALATALRLAFGTFARRALFTLTARLLSARLLPAGWLPAVLLAGSIRRPLVFSLATMLEDPLHGLAVVGAVRCHARPRFRLPARPGLLLLATSLPAGIGPLRSTRPTGV